MSDEKIHYTSQSGAWCGAGWDVHCDSDLDEVTCTACLRGYEGHLRTLHHEVRTRLLAVNLDASRCATCGAWPCACRSADDDAPSSAPAPSDTLPG